MKPNLRSQIRQLGDRIDALSLRERGILFVTLLVALYFVASTLLFGPLRGESLRLETELTQRREQLNALNLHITKVVDAATRDPDQDNSARLQQLSAKLGIVDPRLATATQSLVSPRDMARFVEQVLTRNRALQVVRVESLAPTPVETQASDKGVFKHRMRIEVRGRYLDLVNYMRALEALPWKVFWEQATLTSEGQPASQLTLVIYTLSLREGWIGI
jgi:MSHA biogenesis protein MshJ